MNLNDFFLSQKDKENINNWLQTFDKPLFVSGKTGIGKSTFVNTILKDYTIVQIDHNLIPNITQYIQKTIHETDISMMFQMKKKYKAILFDNILCADKTIIKLLKDIVKQKIKTPYIIVSNNINKQINIIIQNCLHINISYTHDQFKYLLSKNYDTVTHSMIYNSDFNFHMIESNILYFNNDKFINKDNIDSYKKDINVLTNNIKNDFTLDKLFIEYSCDYNTVALNTIDDVYKSVNDNNINDLCKLYECICLYDNYEMFRSKNNLFDKEDLSIFLSICYPYTIIKNSTLKLSKNVSYNSYMSKSLIYTHLHGLYDSKLYPVYDLLIKCIYNIHKENDKKSIIEIFNKYNCNKKVLNNYIKLANFIYDKQINKNMIKEFNNIVK